jgi:hypothetical protein
VVSKSKWEKKQMQNFVWTKDGRKRIIQAETIDEVIEILGSDYPDSEGVISFPDNKDYSEAKIRFYNRHWNNFAGKIREFGVGFGNYGDLYPSRTGTTSSI